jgi:hypothetical protein
MKVIDARSTNGRVGIGVVSVVPLPDFIFCVDGEEGAGDVTAVFAQGRHVGMISMALMHLLDHDIVRSQAVKLRT